MEKWQLQQLQALPLEVKIRKTQERIKEWYEHWNGQVYVSFSGGKDSTVLLHIVREMYPDIEAVFVDTGLEYPEIREFVKTFNNVRWLRPKMKFKQVIEKYGYPVISKETSRKVRQIKNPNVSEKYRNAMLNGDERGSYGKLAEKWKPLLVAPFKCSEQCCDIMKKQPMKYYEHESHKRGFTGSMTDESRLREKQWLLNGCNAFEANRPISNPMSFWTEQDIYQYVQIKNIKICPVYGVVTEKNEIEGQLNICEYKCELITSGLSRTGCMFCMFGVTFEKEPNRFQMMKETHPKQYDYCIRDTYNYTWYIPYIGDDGELTCDEIERTIQGLGLGKVLDYIGVKY